MANYTIEVTADENGNVVIRLPEGRTQQVDAAKVADLTDKLSKALGTVKERHVGRYENGVHTHADGTTHIHQGGK